MFIREFAPAKVNLYLHVVGYRIDKYHTLDSFVVFVNIGDTITIEPASSLTFRVNGPFRSQLSKSDNIVLKAVYLLAEATGYSPNITITLSKYLPVSAGLGGGSADAAATLRGLLRLWQIDMSEEQLINIAVKLGSDVPMCLYNKPVQISGIGENLKAVSNIPPVWLVLVNPLRSLETKKVFKSYRKQRKRRYSITMPIVPLSTNMTSLVHALAIRHNDLEEAAITIEPVIASVLEELSLLSGCALARMSGSGPTCFGLFYSQEAARDGVQTLLSRKRKLWWSTVVTPLSLGK